MGGRVTDFVHIKDWGKNMKAEEMIDECGEDQWMNLVLDSD